jgi:integrase
MARPKATEKKRSNGDGGVWQLENGRWRWELVLGYVSKPDGTKTRKTKSGTAKNETEAKKALTLARADKERGTLATPDRVTVAEWLTKWLATRAARVRPNTVIAYEGIIKKYLVPNLGSKRLQALKPVDLHGFYENLAGEGLTGKTIRNIHGVLYGALSDALRLELVFRNVAEVTRPEVPSQNNNIRASQAWTATEAKTFLDVARGDALYTAFYLMLSLGLRRGEVCGLRWQHIDFESRALRVEESLVTERGKLAVNEPKTRRSKRALRLPLDVLEALRIHKAAQQERHEVLGVIPARDWLFTTRNGTAVHPDNVNRSLERLCKLAGVRQVRVHDLRHTYASLARRAGVPLEVVSEKLGHHAPSFTGDVYRHTFEDEHEGAALELSQLLAERPKAQA